MADPLRRFAFENLRHSLRHGLTTAAFCCFIAAALTISGGGSWGSHLVYSLSIGMISWIVIDLGRLVLSGHREAPWPHGLPGVALVAGGIGIGFLGGTAIGDTWNGAPVLDFSHLGRHELASTLVITFASSVAMCFFFYSLGKSKHLESQIAKAQRDATEARLKLLETQLEPHMLFNTLANLRALIATDPPRAVAMLDHLNSYLRVTLSGSRTLAHPLAAEFERLRDYLALMSVRMGERLRYTLDLPDDLRDLPVPPLLLQPLVENSIRHGLEPRIEGGEIAVRARRVDGPAGHASDARLAIEVIDTGIGLDTALPSDGSGFGLEQVRERLAAVYGPLGTLRLEAGDAGGTRATLVFPLPVGPRA